MTRPVRRDTRPPVEDMGIVRGFPVSYDRATKEHVVTLPDGRELRLTYGDVCDLAGLMHALDHDATRRHFIE